MTKSASSLRPHIVQVMAANQGRPLSTEEIYRLVAASGMVADFDPQAKRDRNLVNRELSDLAGCTTQAHSKPSPQLITRVGRGRYLYREPDRPMDVALLQEYLEPVEVYEKRPARRRTESDRRNVPEEVRMGLYAVQRGVCPGCGFHQPHHRRFDVDHIVALSDDGEDRVFNLQLLCPYCNRVKATQGPEGFRMKMAELRTHNVSTGVMVDAQQAELAGRRLARYHRETGEETM